MTGGEGIPKESELLPREAFGVLLIGPSGVGKSSLAENLKHQKIIEVKPTVATRDRRPTEWKNPPCDHVFWPQTKFDWWKEQGGFIATEVIYDHPYGVLWFTKVPRGLVPLMVLKPVFIEPVLAQYPRMRTIQIEASEATVFKRMREERKQSDADIANRIRQHAKETAIGRRLADCIFKNEGSLESTAAQLVGQIQVEHASYLATQDLAKADGLSDVTIDLPYDATETFA